MLSVKCSKSSASVLGGHSHRREILTRGSEASQLPGWRRRLPFQRIVFLNYFVSGLLLREKDCLLLVVSENCISIRTSVVLNYLSRFSLKFQNFYNFLGGEEDYAVEGQIRLKLTGELSRWP